MQTNTRQSRHSSFKLGLLALLMIPLLLIFNAPVLAAVVPGALLSVALSSIGHERPASLPPAAQVLGPEHIQDLQRMAAATTVDARSRRIG